MQNQLTNLKFPRGYVELHFQDGRILKTPVGLFPAIKRLTTKQRRHWQILDGVGFTFADSDEGFHLRQFGINEPIN